MKKIISKLFTNSQRLKGLIKRILRKLVGLMVKILNRYPLLSGFAIRILNKFPRLKAIVRRLTQSSEVQFSLSDMPLTIHAQQLEQDLLRAIVQRQGR